MMSHQQLPTRLGLRRLEKPVGLSFALTLHLLNPMAALAPAAAEQIEPQAVYDQNCRSCHGADAETLADQTLTLQSGSVVTSARKSQLAPFLARHGRLSDAQAECLADMLIKAFQSGPM